MTERNVFDVRTEPVAEAYVAAIRGSAAISNYFGLVNNRPLALMSPEAEFVLGRLQPSLVRTEQVAEWPGTQLVGESIAERRIYRIDAGSIDVLTTQCTRWFAWENPHLPEDLHFLRADGSVVVGSTSGERDLWLEVDEDELASWRAAVPVALVEALVLREELRLDRDDEDTVRSTLRLLVEELDDHLTGETRQFSSDMERNGDLAGALEFLCELARELDIRLSTTAEAAVRESARLLKIEHKDLM